MPGSTNILPWLCHTKTKALPQSVQYEGGVAGRGRGRETEASPKDKRQTKVNHSRHTHLQWHFKCGRKWKRGKEGEGEKEYEEQGEEGGRGIRRGRSRSRRSTVAVKALDVVSWRDNCCLCCSCNRNLLQKAQSIWVILRIQMPVHSGVGAQRGRAGRQADGVKVCQLILTST